MIDPTTAVTALLWTITGVAWTATAIRAHQWLNWQDDPDREAYLLENGSEDKRFNVPELTSVSLLATAISLLSNMGV